jgi:hypothetical protein
LGRVGWWRVGWWPSWERLAGHWLAGHWLAGGSVWLEAELVGSSWLGSDWLEAGLAGSGWLEAGWLVAELAESCWLEVGWERLAGRRLAGSRAGIGWLRAELTGSRVSWWPSWLDAGVTKGLGLQDQGQKLNPKVSTKPKRLGLE